MPVRPRWRLALAALLVVPAIVAAPPAYAQLGAPGGAASAASPVNSALDGQLLYQLLIGEMAQTAGNAGTAYEWILDAARRTRDETLFRRAVDIALQARAGEQALAATRAWRQARPESLDALRLQLQVLVLLNRIDGLAEPLKALLTQTPEADRPGVMLALPRFLQRASDPRQVAGILEEALAPYRDAPATRVPARVAVGRAWLEARDPDRALALATEAKDLDAAAPGPALLAMELMRERPQAEALVLDYLGRPDAEPALRLAYVRQLTAAQRYADAVTQLETATRLQPEVAPPFLSLGALQLELKRPAQGEAALQRYIELVQRQPAPPASAAEPDGDAAEAPPDQGLVQAWLMLAQSAEQRGDFKAAEAWLAKVDDPRRALEVQARRASILARQGQLEQGRELIRRAPERGAEDQRAKLVAEAGVLREVKHWREAFEVLASANQRFPDDADLMYEQAMMAEKIDRLDEMERLLRRVIEIKPDNAHAHNALGYSLADRSQRLPEARVLIQRALELSPGDPFITDSLGWVEFRLGNREEALRLLQRAYKARPDTEIGAHLGEVLWALGQRDEARRVWLEAKGRDAANDVLRETLARLRVDL
ncbi:MAG: tetratricopeptide repeat protein [Rubrivivax sp.]|nr:tetratricopeptide repeat protein [Rubrivivax sp.]